MTTVGIVSPGFMGAGLGWALREGGARVVASVTGRSARTRRLAAEAGLELLPTVADVLTAADVVLSVTPPGQALAAARAIAAGAREAGSRPLVADLNAVSPPTMAAIASALDGFDVVDGSISGPPPTARPGANVYFSGRSAGTLAALPWSGKIKPIVLGPELGTASALKMCTASVYKGTTALITQALRTAATHGVLDEVLADLDEAGYARTASVASAATKAHRFVDEMREISATQAAAGLTPALFEAIAQVYAQIATTALAAADPESPRALTPADIVTQLGRSA